MKYESCSKYSVYDALGLFEELQMSPVEMKLSAAAIAGQREAENVVVNGVQNPEVAFSSVTLQPNPIQLAVQD